jgi:hypothetical protein
MYTESFNKYMLACKNLPNPNNFAGECSTSSDITGAEIKLLRLGYTDEDVATIPGEPWLQLHLTNGKVLSFSISDISIS